MNEEKFVKELGFHGLIYGTGTKMDEFVYLGDLLDFLKNKNIIERTLTTITSETITCGNCGFKHDMSLDCNKGRKTCESCERVFIFE